MGRRRSSRYDLNGRDIVLYNETSQDLDCLVQNYVAEHRPSNATELGLVHDLAFTRCQQRRLWTLEQDLIRDYTTNTGDSEEQFKAAFVALLENPKLRNIYRHQDHLRARYQRTLHRLTTLQMLASLPKIA